MRICRKIITLTTLIVFIFSAFIGLESSVLASSQSHNNSAQDLKNVQVVLVINEAKMILNGFEKPLACNNLLANDRCLSEPDIFKELGLEVDWREQEDTIIFKDETKELKLVMGEPLPNWNVYPTIVSNHIYVPIRYVGEYFGFKVSWKEDKKLAVIKK